MASTSQQPQSYWKIINQLSVISYQGIGSRGATTNYQLPMTNKVPLKLNAAVFWLELVGARSGLT
ncbi:MULTISPECIES: hypothetical protein [Chroococcidiopsis]|jgi:hypothetical protein|uniref:hypothetical protein n=1 Tax=Chroococcidiopsis TaxID=54298 RepID=UPI0002FDAE80|nr:MULTISPECIES: hypothetical protein [Chroococcidiopsis]MBD2307133.1 hypothetical protein [Chroococcidiopsis sp. [FACHB-1243]]PSB46438.1 hypothetical protein C7B80_13365 [Cyanosarcina cf. burmensis CCALA 770]